MSFEPIENYGVIGNMRSIALVGVNGLDAGRPSRERLSRISMRSRHQQGILLCSPRRRVRRRALQQFRTSADAMIANGAFPGLRRFSL